MKTQATREKLKEMELKIEAIEKSLEDLLDAFYKLSAIL